MTNSCMNSGRGGRVLKAQHEALLEMHIIIPFIPFSHLARAGTTNSELCTNPLNSSENVPDEPTSQSDGSSSSAELPYSQLALLCIRWTKTNQHNLNYMILYIIYAFK